MNLYEIATKLVLQHGWSVIPVLVETKRPTIKWLEYQSRYPELEELQDWFEDADPSKIAMAVVTGKLSNLLIIDSDDGDRYPLGLDAGLVAQTSRGYHLYYEYTEGIRNTAMIDGKKLDVRGEGGYAIIPPSKHKSGKQYKWVKKEKVSKLPSKIVSKLSPEASRFNLKDALGTSTGLRDNNLFKAACSSFSRGEDFDTTLTLVKALNQTFKPPFSEDIVLQKVKSAERYQEKSQIAKPYKMKDLTGEWIQMRKDEEKAPSTGIPGLDKIIKGFIPGHLYTLTAETNAGKTQLAVNFAVNLAMQNKRVAFIALEPDINIITGIKACLANSSYNDAPVDIHNDNIDIFLQRTVPTLEVLKETMKEFAKYYSLVIIDHIGYFVDNEKTVNSQAQVLKELAILTKEAKSAIMIIAHPKKRGESQRRMTLDSISGSAAFKQDSTEVLIMERDKKYPDDEFSDEMSDTAFLRVAKKKVTGSSGSYVKLKFSDKTVRVVEAKNELDNTKLVEEFLT